MTALLAPILQEFFTAHLVTQRAVSAATIRAYRDTWKLFLAYLSDRENVPAHKLETNHVHATEVIAFLDYLENDRGNSVATRNLRLAAIKATMAFQATKAPELLDTVARIHTIPVKKYPKPEVTFLTYGETQALLDAITADSWTGRRDRAMFTLAVQTGLRLSEITELSLASVHLGAAPPRGLHRQGTQEPHYPIDINHSIPAQGVLPRTVDPTRPGSFPESARFRAIRRRRSAKALPAPGQGHVHLPEPRQQARHRAYPAPHRRDAFPRGRHRRRRHRFVARPRITSNDKHLPPRRHRHQTQSSRTHPPARYQLR
jgi:integrase